MHNANLGFPVALSEDIGAELSVCDIGSYCSGDMGSLHWEKDAAVTVGDMKRDCLGTQMIIKLKTAA